MSDSPNAAPPAGAGGVLVTACFRLSELALVGMGVLIAARVLARAVFDYDIEFADEIGCYLLVGMSFLTLPVGQAYRTFHRVEMVHGRLGRRGQAAADLLFHLLSLVFAVVLDGYFVQLVRSSWSQENVAPTMLATPLWIPQLTLVAGTTVVALLLARDAWRDLRRLGGA